MDCSSKNVIYLITCRQCEIQFVGKTSQTLRNRMNNHRNRLKQLGNFYLYNHFNSDGLSLDDISIMPIEAVFHPSEDTTAIGSKLRTILHTLSKHLLNIAWDVTEGYLLEDKIPSRVGILIRDLISFKNKLHHDNIEDKLEVRIMVVGF